VRVRTAFAALAALLLTAAVVTPSVHERDGDGGDGAPGAGVAVDREGPASEPATRPAAVVGTPGAAPPPAVDDGAPGGEDDHVPAQGDPQVVYRYDVDIRGEVTADTDDFAATTERILTDARGWTLGGSVAFERTESDPDFTVVLATPDEVEATHEVCSRDYSCRVEDEILINDRNWGEATPAWHDAEGDLATYRRYLVNHEVGHFLGFGHFDCGGPGEAAPVMQQQSVSMEGCEPNGWPLGWERDVLAQRLGVTVVDPASR
jgi:hypothetical protein